MDVMASNKTSIDLEQWLSNMTGNKKIMVMTAFAVQYTTKYKYSIDTQKRF